jgi:hypothetical protein
MLALTVWCVFAASPTVVVDVPVSLSATNASSGVATTLTPFVGVRGAALFVDDDAAVWGGELTLAASSSTSGGIVFSRLAEHGLTPFAGFSRQVYVLEPRLVWGHTWHNGALALTPLVSAGGVAGVSVLTPFAGSDTAQRLRPAWGVRLGAGALVTSGAVGLRLDVSVGVRDARPELVSGIACGISL